MLCSWAKLSKTGSGLEGAPTTPAAPPLLPFEPEYYYELGWVLIVYSALLLLA